MNIIEYFKNLPILAAGLVIANTGLGKPVTKLTDDEIKQLGAIKIIVSDTVPENKPGVTIFCPLSQKAPSFSSDAMQAALRSSSEESNSGEVIFSVVSCKDKEVEVRLFTIESAVNRLWQNEEHSIIWIKGKENCTEETFFVIDGKSPKFVGSLEIARKAYLHFEDGDKLDSARLKFLTKETSTAKENAILYKAHKLGIVLDEKAFLRAIRTPGTLERFIAYDDFGTMQEFLDAKKVENKNIDKFFSEKCCGLNCIPIQLAALCRSVACFAYIMQETPPQREIYENLMSCALVGGNTAICLLFKEKSENELKGLKIDNRCIELIPMPLLAWSNKVFKVDMSSVSVKAYEYNRPDIVLYCIYKDVPWGRHLDIVQYLVKECNCDPREINCTALHYDSWNGHLGVVEYLVEECNCKPEEIKDNNGRTVLHYASWSGYLDIIKYLFEECATLK